MDDLERLRAEVRERHRAAGQKVSRLRRGAGIELGGTGFDVRRDVKNIDRYNRRQLNAYMRELNQFTSRGTGFEKLGSGEVITREEWLRYKRPEQAGQRARRRREQRLGPTRLPDGATVAERADMLKTIHRQAAGATAANNPYVKLDRKPSDIASRDALRKLTRTAKKRASPEFLAKETKRGRREAAQMMKQAGLSKRTRGRLGNLSDAQFQTLWFDTDFASRLSTAYEHRTGGAGGRGVSAQFASQEAADANTEIGEFLDWADVLHARRGTR